ncbi:MAG: 50S ribosomal protein L16 [Bacilli bacterium]|jgi:large subunit ribosomal protein L16|nr:50S ribosomal protein L16 [Bacilli bacterium]
MLQPKRVEYRHPQALSYEGHAKGGTKVLYGQYGLVATTGNYVNNRQIEAARVVLARYTRKGGKAYVRIFPYLGKTKKPAEVRMGSGKGSIDAWVCPVKVGKIMFEISGVDDETAKEALHQVSYKLPVRSKVVKKGEEGR